MRDQLHEVLCDIIRFHQVLNECCDRMEKVINPFALVKILEISIQICFLALAILKVHTYIRSKFTHAWIVSFLALEEFSILVGQFYQRAVHVLDFEWFVLLVLYWANNRVAKLPCTRLSLRYAVGEIRCDISTNIANHAAVHDRAKSHDGRQILHTFVWEVHCCKLVFECDYQDDWYYFDSISILDNQAVVLVFHSDGKYGRTNMSSMEIHRISRITKKWDHQKNI